VGLFANHSVVLITVR